MGNWDWEKIFLKLDHLLFTPPAWIITLFIIIAAAAALKGLFKELIPGKTTEAKLTFTLEAVLSGGLFLFSFHIIIAYCLEPDKISLWTVIILSVLFAFFTDRSVKLFKKTVALQNNE